MIIQISLLVNQFDLNNVILSVNLARVDSSGLRFFVTDNLRPNDLGFLTFGTSADTQSLVIPPQMSNFTVDSFCPVNVSDVSH